MSDGEQTRPIRLVGRCEVFDEIDSGGMATVHLGRLAAVGGFAKIVAVKRMHDQFAKDPQFVAMFLDEARLVARIKHPNVLPTLDLIEESGELFIVMEYVPGPTLSQLNKLATRHDDRIPMRYVLPIVCGMLHGLHAAHEAKRPTGEPLELVHRDVSPENILIGKDGVARLLDFGMAKALGRTHMTQAGQVKGKLSVMAPEQVQGKEVTRRTDIFASGVVLWQALTGRRLIEGEHMAEIANNVVNQVFKPPSEIVPELPKKLDSIVMRALERDPAKRWSSAEKMALALEAVGDMASQRSVGQWVEKLAWEKLAQHRELVARIEATPIGLDPRTVQAPRISSTQEDSVGPMASSGRHSFDRIADAASAFAARLGRWIDANRRALASAVVRDEGGKLRLRPTADNVIHDRQLVSTGLGGLVLALAIALVIAIAAGNDTPAVAERGIAPAPQDPSAAASAPPAAPAAKPAAAPTPQEGLITLAPGEFLLGCNTWADRACAPDEKPGRTVRLDAFEIERTEVTVRDYQSCIAAGSCSKVSLDQEGVEGGTLAPSDRCNFGRSGREDHPMNCVSFAQAEAYCAFKGSRLPTEAEWERAAGGSDSWPYPTGEPTIDCTKAVMSDNGDGCGRGTTWPVGSKPEGASPEGALDMAGNVAEWVADWYDPARYRTAPPDAVTGPEEGLMRVVRGGSWRDPLASKLRTSARDKLVPATHSIHVGFRCARSKPAP